MLSSDLKKLNQLFNSKIAYYKSLQGISDTLKVNNLIFLYINAGVYNSDI